MGKWGVALEQNIVKIDINLMANNSSPSTGASGKYIMGLTMGSNNF